MRLADLVITPKKGYVHVLWDVFPQARKPDSAARLAALQDLVKKVVLKSHPKAALIKVDVVEFRERDEYGEPHWASVRKIEKLELQVDSGRVSAVKGNKKGAP